MNNRIIFTKFYRSFSSNTDVQKNIEIPLYQYIDKQVDSKFSEIKSILELMRADNENFQKEMRSDFKHFEEKINTKFEIFEGNVNYKMMAKAAGAAGIVFISGGAFITFLGSIGIKINPPKMYLEENVNKPK